MTHIVPTAREAVMEFVNRQEPFRINDVIRLGYSNTRVRSVVQELRERGICHVMKWERVGPKSIPQMILIAGQGVDAKVEPVPAEVQLKKKRASTRRSYKRAMKKANGVSVHRKTRYGLYSYYLDSLLSAMEEDRTFTTAKAAKFMNVSLPHAQKLVRRARRANLICIVDWDMSNKGRAPVYGWRHIGMTDVAVPKRGARKRKRMEIVNHVKQWGWLYGAARA